MCYQNHFSIPPVSPWVLGKVQYLLFQCFEVNHCGLISFGLWCWVECRGSVASSEGRLALGRSEISKYQNIRSEFLLLHQLYWGSQAGLSLHPSSDMDRDVLVLLKMFLAHLSLHLGIATAFPIWNVAFGVCVVHVLGPLWSLYPPRHPPICKSDLGFRCTAASAPCSPSSWDYSVLLSSELFIIPYFLWCP